MATLPKRKDCRVDITRISGGFFYTLLVDCVNNNVILFEAGTISLKDMYLKLKYLHDSNSEGSGISFDNFPLTAKQFALPFSKIEGIKYQY